MTYEFWAMDERDGISIAALNTGPMNYMTAGAIGELKDIITSWRNPDVRVAIITGAVPDKYITHYSVEELVDMGDDPQALATSGPDLIYPYHQLLQSLTKLPKPVIAAMSGDTMGCGLELSLNCDIRIAQRGDYVIGFPEVALGILTGTGSQLLARSIGQGPALDFMLRSRTVSPEGALELGIVHELADDARGRAIEVAQGLVRQSPVSLAAAKRSVIEGANLPIAEGLRIEAEEWLKTIVTDVAMEKMRDYVAQPYSDRNDWVRRNGVPPAAGSAKGA
jgi:enoyl-CoA hydratase/carnithine racemase